MSFNYIKQKNWIEAFYEFIISLRFWLPNNAITALCRDQSRTLKQRLLKSNLSKKEARILSYGKSPEFNKWLHSLTGYVKVFRKKKYLSLAFSLYNFPRYENIAFFEKKCNSFPQMPWCIWL